MDPKKDSNEKGQDSGKWLTHPLVLLALRFVPVIGQNAAQFLVEWREHRIEKARKVIQQASRDAGLSEEELLGRMAQTPRLSDLFLGVAELAYRTSMETKLRLLAKVMASGALAEDDAAVDEAELLLKTLSQLETPHIKALILLSREHEKRGPVIFAPDVVKKAFGDEAVAEAILGALQAQGLLQRGPSGMLSGGPTWKVTAYGQKLLSRLAAPSDGL